MEKVICNFGDMEIDKVSIMQQEGFSDFSLTENQIMTYDAEGLKGYLSQLNKSNLELKCLDTKIGLDIVDLEEIREIFLQAKNAKVKAVCCYGYRPSDKTEYEIINDYQEIVNLAKQFNILLLIRNNQETILNRADKLYDFVVSLKSQNVKIMMDTAEFAKNNELLIPAYRHIKEELALIFLSDINEYFQVVPLGMGITKISDFMAILNKDAYRGALMANLDFSVYLKRKELYKKAKYNLFFRLNKIYKSCLMIDDKLGKKKKDDVSNRYLVSWQLRSIKKML